VFHALERGYLDTLQVFVTNPSATDLSVLESYHFTFAYEHARVRGIRVSPVEHTFELKSAQKSFRAAARALLRSLRDLPRLPGLWFALPAKDSADPSRPQKTRDESCV
jgi:hypothetical protein